MLPQQLLMLQAAADAFEDAGLGGAAGGGGGAERLDTGVIIGAGLDINTTNFRPSLGDAGKGAGVGTGGGDRRGGD